ncbi:nucleic acid-binding protein [Saccharata proteae CBS 121410]|uniref:rRNA biogenesis protein RRP5 n=1 Tax=Saccharata proteae CBS 121410 TaxID=1314787 RepID=A0A9P4M0L7_9PEZI|nr:nucleic acid-binding protein [Saccharata proteae CBS 121410]
MAPIKRGADSDAAASKKPTHNADGRAPKRQRKSEDGNAKPAKQEKPAQPSLLKLEESAFPRGGASVLTPLEHKQIQNEATRDVLFEQSSKRAAKDAKSDDEMGDGDVAAEKSSKKRRKGKNNKKGAAEETEAKTKIEGLSYKRLVPGSMVLGQVTQITSRDIALALPNNLTGFVPLTAISEQLTQRAEALANEEEKSEDGESDDDDDIVMEKLFSIGQYLRACVTSTGDDSTTSSLQKNKKRIELSVNPRETNTRISKSDLVANAMVQASVVSVEDHGLVMDLGLADGEIKGFMSSKEVGHAVDHTKIEQGAVFLCVVTGTSSNGKIVKLSADYQRIGNTKKANYLTEAPTIDVFLPGTAVEMLVTDVMSTGIIGQIMGMLDATADIVHVGAGHSEKDIANKYKVGSKVKARIICTFPDAEPRKVGISLLDHVLNLSTRDSESKSPLEIHPMSSFIESAKVFKIESVLGAFMDVGTKGVPGFAHISRLSDGKVESLSESSGAYKLGSTHRARVVGYNPVDGMYLLSLEQKILDQPFLRIEDVKAGDVVKGKVEKLFITTKGQGAVIVNLADGISGMVSEPHMADVKLQHPEKKFREGMPVTARVLFVNPEKRQMGLTLKKSLVNSDAPVWTRYSDAHVGDQAPGTVINVLPKGAVIQFYENVRAFLPVSEMSEAYIQNPAEHFRVGQTVNVHVISIDADNDRMTVSCKDPSAFDSQKQELYKTLTPGTIVEGTVSEKSDSLITVELEDSGIKGVLRLGQLTDGSSKKDVATMKRIRVGQNLEDLVIIEQSDKRPLLTLSNKPSLVQDAKKGTLITKIEDLKKGQTVNGFVRNIDDNTQNVFIQFGGGVIGLLMKSQVSDAMKLLPDFGLRIEQSISARVLSVDHERRRFLLTMREEDKTVKPAPKVAAGDGVLVNPVDESCKTISDLSFGKVTTARINHVKATQLNVQLADNLQGRVDASEAFADWNSIKSKKHPLRQFTPKDTITVRVMGVHDARNHKFLPISHRAGKNVVIELTAKPAELSSESDLLTMDKIKEGSSHVAFVNNIADDCVWVNLTPNVRGRVDLLDLSDDASLLTDIPKNFPPGSALKVQVKHVDASKGRLDLTTRTSSSKPLTLQDLSAGMILPARVTKVTERNVVVQLGETVSAPVQLTELADDYDQANPTVHNKNDIVRVCVLDVSVPNKSVHLTMRPSKVLSSSLPVKDPQVASIRQVKVNDVVRGFVKNVMDKGVFVSLAPNVTAFVRISDLSDSYVKDWKSLFEVDQLVKGKILSVDPSLNHIQMTLKASMLDKAYVPPTTFSDLKPGQHVTGKIRKVEDFGVFIVVDNSSNVSGLCHRSEIADQQVEDVTKLYSVGDAVKAVVLKVEPEKRRVNFGLKASYFKNEDDEDSEDDDMDGGVELNEADDDSDEDVDMDGEIDWSKVQDMESDEEDSAEEMDVDDDAPKAKSIKGLTTSGFDWTGESLEQKKPVDQEASDAEDDAAAKKKKKRKPEIKVDRTGDLDIAGPQSVADFERLLLGQPNSSELWMQYMAFQIGLNEVGKAREIGERALKTINIREQDEKMNIWTALLNLEIEQGNDEAVDEVFKRACQYNDAEEMHNKLISIYTSTGRHEKADTLFQTMTKNKSITPNPSFWINYATFLMTTLSQPARARQLLPRATQSVPTPMHRHLTAKFAALEFQSPNGDPERGRTIFEGLLATWPKRWDLWDMFLALEMVHGTQEGVRGLWERMSKMGMKKRRARYVFGKWAEWEQKSGQGKKGAERVEGLAREYVERMKAKGGEDEDGDEE